MIRASVFTRGLLTACMALVCVSAKADTPKYSSIDLNNLRVTNRAQCAIDSETPADSAFLILDGFNSGKMTYMLANSLGMDPVAMSADGMKEFRLAVSHLTLKIMQKLQNGNLPLLPMNLKTNPLKNYQNVVQLCDKKPYCADLNNYLSGVWALSENEKITSKSPEWKKLDTFTSVNFLPTKTLGRIGCYYLKRFSPLQGHLQNTGLDQAVLQDMAVAVMEQEKYITTCYDQDPELDSRNAAMQIDLKVLNQDQWKASGYDYWNSVKIYLSWAWRNSGIPSEMSQRFGIVFKSIALEESMMFLPNGCKSITKPACDSEHISLNSLREIAKAGDKPTEHSNDSPQKPEQGLIEHGARAVNDDFLGTQAYDSASEWVANFRKHFVQNRGLMKTRLATAVQFMNILMESLSAEEVVEYVKPLALTSNPSAIQRDELYYLCTEIRLAGDKRIDFMKTDIDNLSRLNSMEKAFESSRHSMPEFVTYFDKLASGILPVCDQLEKTGIWNAANYTVNKAGFYDWSKEILNIKAVDDEGKPLTYTPAVYGSPLLVWPQGDPVCVSGIDCSRLAIKSLVDLYSVAVYADAFLPISSSAASPDVFNPYSELKACKIYDPWFATKRANKRLASDLASTFAFGWNFLPIYMDNDFTPDTVTSFKKLMSQGKLQFDPQIDKGKMQMAVVADLGPLVGAPCAISIAPNSAKKFDFYAFKGISVNYCNAKNDGEVHASGPNDVYPQTPKTYSYCGGCSMNFVGIATAASSTAAFGLNPIKFGIYLFRSIHRFITAKKDNVNIPKSYDVNLNYVADAYQRYGEIPKNCVDMLGQGLRCFDDICGAKAADYFEKRTGGKVTKIQVIGSSGSPAHGGDPFDDHSVSKTAWITSNLCSGQITMPFQCRSNGSGFYTSSNTPIRGATDKCRGKKF